MNVPCASLGSFHWAASLSRGLDVKSEDSRSDHGHECLTAFLAALQLE
jgi:hypothetical protein